MINSARPIHFINLSVSFLIEYVCVVMLKDTLCMCVQILLCERQGIHNMYFPLLKPMVKCMYIQMDRNGCFT